MKKKRIILSIALASISLFAISSCGDNEEKSSSSIIESSSEEKKSSSSAEEKSSSVSSSDEEGTYTVTVYDIDGEKLSTYNIDIEKGKSFVDQLKENANVKYTDESWGTYIKAIDNSIEDGNYFLALYENNVASMVGVDQIQLDDGDVIDFKVECYNSSFTETDKLVDKAVYQYLKKYLNNDFTNDTSFSKYWSYICYYLLGDNSTKYVTLNSDLSAYLDTYDVTSLSDTNYGKYYYTARAYGKNLDSFKTQYKTFLDGITSPVGTYTIPFEVSFAKNLNISSDIIDLVKDANYDTEPSWGSYDGTNWYYVAQLACGKDANTSFLTSISQASYNNSTSLAISLDSFAASGVNPNQSAYLKDGKSLVERLFDSYDEELGLIKYKTTDTSTEMSTNQIYTSLISYKAFRDSGKAVNYLA